MTPTSMIPRLSCNEVDPTPSSINRHPCPHYQSSPVPEPERRRRRQSRGRCGATEPATGSSTELLPKMAPQLRPSQALRRWSVPQSVGSLGLSPASVTIAVAAYVSIVGLDNIVDESFISHLKRPSNRESVPNRYRCPDDTGCMGIQRVSTP